jgi:hypothetical protein
MTSRREFALVELFAYERRRGYNLSISAPLVILIVEYANCFTEVKLEYHWSEELRLAIRAVSWARHSLKIDVLRAYRGEAPNRARAILEQSIVVLHLALGTANEVMPTNATISITWHIQALA